jgi:hypothetical protein
MELGCVIVLKKGGIGVVVSSEAETLNSWELVALKPSAGDDGMADTGL